MRQTAWAAAMAALLALCAGCRGSAPELNSAQDSGLAAIIIEGRIITAAGQTRSGRIWINLETEESDADAYRLSVKPEQALLYQIEPGAYRLAPTRGVLGVPQPAIKIIADGRTYMAPFPRELLRKAVVRVKPGKVTPLGILTATVVKSLPDRPDVVTLELDDSVEARRGIVQTVIKHMMDSDTSADEKESAIAWTRALDQTLIDVLSESPRAAPFKAQP